MPEVRRSLPRALQARFRHLDAHISRRRARYAAAAGSPHAMVRPRSCRRPMMLRSTDQSRPLPRIDIGRNRFASVGLGRRGRDRAAQKWSRDQDGGSPHPPVRHGGLCRHTSPEPTSRKAWSPYGADAGSMCWQGERGGARPAIDGAARSARIGPIASGVAAERARHSVASSGSDRCAIRVRTSGVCSSTCNSSANVSSLPLTSPSA
jgi:hypothetical protein